LYISAATKNRLTQNKNDIQSVADGDRRSVEIGLHRFDIRRSGTQIRWNLLLRRLASETIVATNKIGDLLVTKNCGLGIGLGVEELGLLIYDVGLGLSLGLALLVVAVCS